MVRHSISLSQCKETAFLAYTQRIFPNKVEEIPYNYLFLDYFSYLCPKYETLYCAFINYV